MKRSPYWWVPLQCLTALFLLSSASAQTKNNSAQNPLKTVADIPLPAPAIRFDYQSLDASTGRLYTAHVNADHLVIFENKTRKVTANIGGFTRVHGVLVVPAIEKLFASATGDHEVAAFNRSSLVAKGLPSRRQPDW